MGISKYNRGGTLWQKLGSQELGNVTKGQRAVAVKTVAVELYTQDEIG
jgi:hypothetical protein